MHRRAFLASASALPLATALSRQAKADGHATLPPVVQTYSVGDAKVTVISDGYLMIDHKTMNNVSEKDFAEAMARAHIPSAVHPTGVNAHLIEFDDRRILIDAGTGNVFGPDLGDLGKHLKALGIAPESIDTIIATHLHPDHIGGAYIDQQNPFSNAELIVSEEELSFWTDEDLKAKAPDTFKVFFDLAAGAAASFGERVKTVSGEADLGAGLTAMPLPGHTPGHMGVMLDRAGAQIMFWGDIIHVGPLQFADPSITIAFDAIPDLAAQTRATVLDMARTDNLLVAGAHVDFPGMGYVEQAGSGYRFLSAPYPYG